jgi:hypothetical protein
VGRNVPALLGASAILGLAAMLGLRQFVSSPKGRAREATAREAAAIRVTIEVDETLVLEGEGGTARPLGSLRGTPEKSARAIDELRRSQVAPAQGDAPAVEVRAPRAVDWLHVAWVVGALLSPEAPRRELRFSLSEDNEPAVGRLFLGRQGVSVIDVGQEEIPVLVVQFLDPDFPTAGPAPPPFRLRVAHASTPRESEPSGLALAQEFQYWQTGWTERESVHRATVDALMSTIGIEAFVPYAAHPLRLRLSYGDVLAVLRGLRDVDQAPVLLGGLLVDHPRR